MTARCFVSELGADRDNGMAILRGGDLGWNEGVDVTDGSSGNLVLTQEEQLWFQACLLASQPLRSDS